MSTSPDVATGARASAEQPPSPAHAILARAQADRVVLQDYCPLADSIEWQLGQRYWDARGSQAFLGDAQPVPYVINNDGTLSHNAAAVLFASLAAAERAGPLPETLFVLELGIGVGLFARFFLDAFRDLCRRHGADYYDRLCYVAGDRSPAMLRDAARHGIFAQHPGRYLLRIVDACQPEQALLADAALAPQAPRPLRAVFLNYVLDCLPVTVLEVADAEVRQLCVRTCLARGVSLEEYTDLKAEDLARRAGSTAPDDERALLDIYGLFASEYTYRPVDIGQVPYGEFAARFGRSSTRRVLHNHGAIQSLERLLGLLHADGFVLLNDYGPTHVALADEPEHQRFSRATSIGLNFPLLKAYFAEGGRCRWEEPLQHSAGIHARLLGPTLAHETRLRFHECFGRAASERLEEPVRQARGWAQAGRLETALACYRRALEQQPSNWLLLGEVAHFLTYSLADPKAGVDLVKVALGLNPLSAELWDTLGDGLLEWGRLPEARQAYKRALQLNANDLRAHASLASVHVREKDYPAALRMIAEALARDFTGHFRERLLQKQSEILARLAQRNQQEQLRQANRVSTAAASPTPPAGPAASALASPGSPPPWR